MRKNQSGVSMVSLVITIIVIIILAAVAFTGSNDTIGRASFSDFTTDIESIEQAFLTEGVTNLVGNEAAKSNPVTEAQAYNYLAKGATTKKLTDDQKKAAWLTKSKADAIQCTRIEKDAAKEAIGIELPARTVNTYGSTGVEVSYFVTNDGDIFAWPPFLNTTDGCYYVNRTQKVVDATTKNIISGDDEKLMYPAAGGLFKFKVDDVEIHVSPAKNIANTVVTKDQAFTNIPGVYYEDVIDTPAADGIESIYIYQDNGAAIAGYDKVDS